MTYPIAMGSDHGIVRNQLNNYLIWMHIQAGISTDLILTLCKDYVFDIRSVYLGSDTVAFIDYVPSEAITDHPLLQLNGSHTVGDKVIVVEAVIAATKVDQTFIEDYTRLITTGKAKAMHKTYLINNSKWRAEAVHTPPPTALSLEGEALHGSSNLPSSTPKNSTDTKQFFTNVLRGAQELTKSDLTSLISALMKEDKIRNTGTEAASQSLVAGNPGTGLGGIGGAVGGPALGFQAGGLGVADLSHIPKDSSINRTLHPVSNHPTHPPHLPLTMSNPRGTIPPPTYSTINHHRGTHTRFTQPVVTSSYPRFSPPMSNNPVGTQPASIIPNTQPPHTHLPSHTTDYANMEKSFQAMSEGIIRAVVNEGVLRQDIPKLDAFSGKTDGEKVSWRKWELQVKGLEGSYTEKAIKEAMLKSLKGDAFVAAEPLSGVCTWQQLLDILRGKFTTVSSLDVLMGQFYQISQGSDTVAQFAIRLEHHLGSIRTNHPGAVSDVDFFRHLKERLFHGLSDRIRASLRHKYDTQGVTYHDLLAYARVIEGERGMIETSVNESVPTAATTKPAAKGSAVQQGADVDKLAKAFSSTQGELHKLQKQLMGLTQVVESWNQMPATGFQAYAPSYQPQGGRGRGNGQSQQQQHQQGGRGQGAPRNQQPQQSQQQRGFNQPRGNPQWPQQQGQAQRNPNRPGNWNRLCFWCRDYAPADQANHLIKNCPYYNQGRKDWWTQQGISSDNQPVPSSGNASPN